MTDAKKVIKGLENCIATSDRACPDDCPYYSICWDSSKGGELLYYSLMKDALELLNEQEPKQVVYKNDRYTGVNVSTCPKCERRVDMYYMSNCGVETKFCPYCGCGVKWDTEGE